MGEPESKPIVRSPWAKNRARNFTLLAKLAVTAALGWWLFRTKLLDAGSLKVLAHPDVAVWVGFTFVFTTLGVGTLRWRLLLHAFGVSVPPLRAAALQLMALFFNAVVPGNLGGDLVKNLYVIRGRPVDVVALALGERLIGMVALIWTGWLVSLVSISFLERQPQLRPLLLLLTVLAVGSALGPFLLLVALRRWDWAGRAGRLGALLKNLSAAAQVLTERPAHTAGAFALSLLIHAGNLSFFFHITRALSPIEPDFSTVALIFPIGLLTLMLPVSVAGLGVGHLAFDRLFAAVGLSGGANVFHAFIVGGVGPCLTGAIPYLLMRRARGLPPRP